MGSVVALRQELDSFYTESWYGQDQVLSEQSFKLEVHRWVSLWQEEPPRDLNFTNNVRLDIERNTEQSREQATWWRRRGQQEDQ